MTEVSCCSYVIIVRTLIQLLDHFALLSMITDHTNLHDVH